MAIHNGGYQMGVFFRGLELVWGDIFLKAKTLILVSLNNIHLFCHWGKLDYYLFQTTCYFYFFFCKNIGIFPLFLHFLIILLSYFTLSLILFLIFLLFLFFLYLLNFSCFSNISFSSYFSNISNFSYFSGLVWSRLVSS